MRGESLFVVVHSAERRTTHGTVNTLMLCHHEATAGFTLREGRRCRLIFKDKPE